MTGNIPQRPDIVVVEDDAGVANAVKRVLQSNGYEVHLFNNGPDALKKLKELGKPVVLLTDYDLKPDAAGVNLNGIEIIQKAKALNLGIQPVLTSANPNLEEWAKKESIEYLEKPADRDALLGVIAAAQSRCTATEGVMTGSAGSASQKPLVVYAEDNEGIRISFEFAFGQAKGQQYELAMFNDGAPALERIKQEVAAGRQVILITDHDMPSMSGKELLEQLKAASISIPTVMHTSQTTAGDVLKQQGLLDEIVDKKKLGFDDVFAAMDRAITAHQSRSKVSLQNIPKPPGDNTPKLPGF